ncbi:MAG: hypothetical protein ACTS3R_08575 [Inquilinaceae bacterium]
MPERRHAYAEVMAARGLAPPDERTMHLLWQIVDEGVLGASNHVRLTHDLLRHLMESVADPDEAWQRVSAAATFIAETRGAEAPIVGNALRLLLAGLSGLPAGDRRQALGLRIETWREDSDRRLARLVNAAVATIGAGRSIVAYDYSSTVAAIVAALAAGGRVTDVIVPESRAIAGGRRYLDAFVQVGIPIRYVLDAAFEHVLSDQAVVLLGAESVRCDGSLTNTIGSRPLARLARWRGCPVYGCTDLLKLDLRSYRGHFAEPSVRKFDHLLDGVALPDGAAVTTVSPELEVVPPGLLTGFLTDHGLVPPAAIWGLGRDLFDVATGIVDAAPADVGS